MKKMIMKIARSPLGGSIAFLFLTRLRFLLPVPVLDDTPVAIAFRHPTPICEGHCLIVPKKRLIDIRDLFADSVYFSAFTRYLQTSTRESEYPICCNFGNRQEVRQVHFHRFPCQAITYAPSEVISESDEWTILKGGRCLIKRQYLCDIAILQTVFRIGHECFPEGMSIFWI